MRWGVVLVIQQVRMRHWHCRSRWFKSIPEHTVYNVLWHFEKKRKQCAMKFSYNFMEITVNEPVTVAHCLYSSNQMFRSCRFSLPTMVPICVTGHEGDAARYDRYFWLGLTATLNLGYKEPYLLYKPRQCADWQGYIQQRFHCGCKVKTFSQKPVKIRQFTRLVYRKGHLPFEQERMVQLHCRVQQARSTRERTCRLCWDKSICK